MKTSNPNRDRDRYVDADVDAGVVKADVVVVVVTDMAATTATAMERNCMVDIVDAMLCYVCIWFICRLWERNKKSEFKVVIQMVVEC